MTKEAPTPDEQAWAEYRIRLADYRKSVMAGWYEVNARYDRTALAITGSGFVLFIAVIDRDSSTFTWNSLLMTFMLTCFVISILLITLRQYCGALAHKKVVDKVDKIDQGDPDVIDRVDMVDLPGDAAELWAHWCFIASLPFLIMGVVTAIVYIAVMVMGQ